MTLNDLIKLIHTKHYVFEASVSGKTHFGKLSADQADMLQGSLGNYFTTIAKANQVSTLTVSLFAKNGSSHIKKETVQVEIPQSIEKSTSVEKSTNPIEKSTPLVEKSTGLFQAPVPHTNQSLTGYEKHTPMITKADIEVVQLKTENKYLGEKVDELKARNKELERRNDEYYNENLKLTREHATEKDKRDLEFKQKELDLATKQKQGLSGIMDEVKSMPPEAWQFIAGCLPNHPMSKGLLPQANDSALNGNPAKHTDPDAQACIEVINSLLLNQSPEIVGMLAMLTEHLAINPPVLKAVYEKFFPQQTETTTH